MKGTYGTLTFFNFIITYTNRGYQCNTRGVLWVGDYPSRQMLIISDIFRVEP